MSAQTLLRWLPATLWAAVIFFFSSRPGSDVPARFAEVLHLLVYAVFGALLVVALRWRHEPGEAAAIAVLLASVYAVTDEFHQSFVPMRTPDVTDWGLDTVGALLGAAAMLALLAWLERRRTG